MPKPAECSGAVSCVTLHVRFPKSKQPTYWPEREQPIELVFDRLSYGHRFFIPNVIDDFSRKCLAVVVDTILSGGCVARELERIVGMRGFPSMVVSHNGIELTSNAIPKW